MIPLSEQFIYCNVTKICTHRFCWAISSSDPTDCMHSVESSWAFLIRYLGVMFTLSTQTWSFSQPFSIPSSMALILLPARFSILRLFSVWNSAVENIGFKVSPSRLSDKYSSISSSWMPAKTLSESRRIAFSEKSSFLIGKLRLANVCK